MVGGSVRDLLLKQVPKDYDVLSTASLSQVVLHTNHTCGFYKSQGMLAAVHIAESHEGSLRLFLFMLSGEEGIASKN